MSLSNHRPDVTVNGIRRMRLLLVSPLPAEHKVSNSNPFETYCPYCFRELNRELDVSRPRPRAGLEPYQATARVFDTLAVALDPSTRRQNTNFDRRTRWEPSITLNFVDPSHQQPSLTVEPLENIVPPRHNHTGNDLEGFIENLTENDRPGPPPAAASDIEALPTVKITENHLINSAQYFPVCKDEFEVGDEARQLPRKHLYHSDCIVPWLSIHNTCPICRYEINDDNNAAAEDSKR